LVILADDGGDHVAAKGRARGQQQFLDAVAGNAHVELRAVGGQAGAQAGCHRAGQVTPQRGSAHQENSGLYFLTSVVSALVYGLFR